MQETQLLLQRTITDYQARKEILIYLKQKKKQGKTKISIIDLVADLQLPAQQIEKIMENLEGASL